MMITTLSNYKLSEAEATSVFLGEAVVVGSQPATDLDARKGSDNELK